MRCEMILEVCRDTGAERQCLREAQWDYGFPCCTVCKERTIANQDAEPHEFKALATRTPKAAT